MTPEPAIVRHHEFYFSDGSVVIIVERTAFRVHQSILARHSEVFNGLWEVPQPSRMEVYDGCPSMHLSGDSVDDFVDVMRVIYDVFHFDRIKPDTSLSSLITFLSGILRISTKYHMQGLRNKCITIIQDKFPSTLSGCDEILPWAFYLCTHISVNDILANSVLSWQDKALCLAGKERLWEMQKWHTHAFMLDFKQAPQCASNCSARIPRPLKLENFEVMRINPHPLEEYKDWKTLNLCQRCQTMAETQHRNGREKVWQELPSLFHLGKSWDNICEDQDS
ncbi:hypothetical protein M413DRAFT_20350 [Hebeloma cylindrosporum]|uniref:BTB domain-containing protein n=1 Tax=Hebeloma cylindrosporum TaxID=76867 RepID=A0A0C3C109_HEBCY|nr:hypothetical protein M413DRAFT_20350 [Hebeloma cylindrosporum h7]